MSEDWKSVAFREGWRSVVKECTGSDEALERELAAWLSGGRRVGRDAVLDGRVLGVAWAIWNAHNQLKGG